MALTWQNVSPSNPAGILQAGNMAAANIAKGLSAVGGSMQEYAKNAKEADTGKLLLMLDNAKDRNERQAILDNTDMDYIDQDIIAKDNQEFDAIQQQKADVAFSQGIQTEEAAAKKAQRAFMRTKELNREEREIASDAATADFRAETLKNQRNEQELAKLNRIEDLRLLTAKTAAETLRNKRAEAREISQYGRLEKEHNIKMEQLKKDQKLIEQGDELTTQAAPRLRDANTVDSLVDLRKDYRDARLKRIPGAQGIMDAINVKIAKVIDLPSIYGGDITMAIEGKTQAEKVRSHSSNLQKTVGRLKTILPASTSVELQTMAEDILRKSSPVYAGEMSKLKITSKEFNDNYLLNFRGDLRTYTYDDDGLTNADIVNLRERFTGNEVPITPENTEAIETITGILDTKYKDNFNKTPLGTLLSYVDANELKSYMEIASVAGEVDGVVDKERVKAKHNANVQNLVNKLRPVADYADKLTNDEMKKKVTEDLLRDPAYADIVSKAGVSYIEDMKRDKNQARMRFNNKIGKAETAEDFAGIIDYAESEGILDETTQSMFTSKISGKALQDTDIINTQINIDPATFTYDGWETWERQAKFEIKEKWERIPESTVDKMIASIVDNPVNKPLKVAITSYKDLQAYKANLQTKMNELTTAQKLTDAKFNIQFEEAPIETLTNHVLSAPTRKLVLDSLASAEDPADLQDTISDAWELTNHVYKALKEANPKDTPKQLGRKSKRVLDTIVPENELFGEEFTVDDFPSKEDIVRASKENNLFRK